MDLPLRINKNKYGDFPSKILLQQPIETIEIELLVIFLKLGKNIRKHLNQRIQNPRRNCFGTHENLQFGIVFDVEFYFDTALLHN